MHWCPRPAAHYKAGKPIHISDYDRFSKLVDMAPLSSILAGTIAKAFVNNWALVYGLPRWRLSNNEPQLTSKFFQYVCRILDVANLFSKTYHLQCSEQVRPFNKTIIEVIRHFVVNNRKKWDLHTNILTYAYNTQIHRGTVCAPLSLPYQTHRSSWHWNPQKWIVTLSWRLSIFIGGSNGLAT